MWPGILNVGEWRRHHARVRAGEQNKPSTSTATTVSNARAVHLVRRIAKRPWLEATLLVLNPVKLPMTINMIMLVCVTVEESTLEASGGLLVVCPSCRGLSWILAPGHHSPRRRSPNLCCRSDRSCGANDLFELRMSWGGAAMRAARLGLLIVQGRMRPASLDSPGASLASPGPIWPSSAISAPELGRYGCW